TLGALLRDLLRTLARHRDVQLHAADLDAEVRQAAEPRREVRALQHRLRRDAAPVVARAAQLVRLDAPDLHPELGRPDRRDVPAGARADHNHIERVVRHAAPRVISGPENPLISITPTATAPRPLG